MIRRGYALLSGIVLAALVGCAEHKQAAPRPAPEAATSQKTIALGATRLDPSNLTIAAGAAVGFTSTADEPLQLEFISPKDQADRIKCHVADPKSMKAGEAPWGTFRANAEGRLTADIPPGRFPSVCTLAPGAYIYVVRHLGGINNPALRTPQEGTITVK